MEYIFETLIFVLVGFFYYKTKRAEIALDVLKSLLPALKEMAEKTETKLDDKAIAFIESLIGDPPEDK